MTEGEGSLDLATARLEAVAGLARAAPRPMTPLQRMDGLRNVTARLGARRAWRKTIAVVVVAGSATIAVAAFMLTGWASRHATASRHQSLSYRIAGGEIGDGGYVRASSANGALLRFEEGTELRLVAGARGRLTSVDERGARLTIEEGEADVKVTPRPGARWLVDAGPFLITVRGTVFTASWNGLSEQLDIHMKKGLVSVAGPLADGLLAVRAGQRLTVDMRRKEVLLRQVDGSDGSSSGPGGPGDPSGSPEGPSAPGASLDGEGSAGVGPGLKPAPGETSRPGGPARGSARGSGRSPRSRNWTAELAAGNLDFILHDAGRGGLRHTLRSASSEDLAALADAARYRRQERLATTVLEAQRERFPNSSRARDSAFLLGRIEEAQPAGGERAIGWYDRYLKEAPSGAYSSEALGRKMTATERLRGMPAAREVAEAYLWRFPNGTYAGAARALLRAP